MALGLTDSRVILAGAGRENGGGELALLRDRMEGGCEVIPGQPSRSVLRASCHVTSRYRITGRLLFEMLRSVIGCRWRQPDPCDEVSHHG